MMAQGGFIMRLAHTAFAFLISTGCVLALTADARAASCKTQQYKGHALEGLWQYQLGNNSCTPLTDVEVTVAVTEDIVVAASTKNYDGFTMQLNANGPSSGLTPSQLVWQQFVIHVGSGSVNGFTQQWPSDPKQKLPGIYPSNNIFMGAPSTINNTFLTIKAGTTFTWKLKTDSKGNVESVTYSATDKLGTNYTPVTENIPAGDRAPIYSITMDIVGYNDASCTWFQSGAGTITYAAKSFSASYDSPKCANNQGTGENSNMRYESLNAVSGGRFTQEFCVPAPVAPEAQALFDTIDVTLQTGNDNADSNLEILANLSNTDEGNLCLKPSSDTSLPPGNANINEFGNRCANSSSAPSWNNGQTTTTNDVKLKTKLKASQVSASSLGISAIQSSCGLSCSNWDLQAIRVTFLDSACKFFPINRVIGSFTSDWNDSNCVARLKAPPNSTAVLFGLNGSNTHTYVDGKSAGWITTCQDNGDGGSRP
jgi:hypothetical protein